MKKLDPAILPLGAATSDVPFPLQFHTKVDLRSFATTPILFYDHDGELIESLHATGFCYRYGGRTFLCTARHCLTGMNVLSGKPISATAYVPPRIGIFPAANTGESTARFAEPLQIDLTGPESEVRWAGDPNFEQLKTDIACVEIHHELAPHIRCVNEMPDKELYAAAGASCFILGYPNRNFAPPYIPIWRRGSFASEPVLPVDAKPLFLLDAQTSEGMSGSPIFQVWFGPAPFEVGEDKPQIQLDSVTAARLVGVYGGRLSSKNQMAEIGLAWYANRIPIIIEKLVQHQVGTSFK